MNAPVLTRAPATAKSPVERAPRERRRVLYVSATDELSGADRSLFELVRCVDARRYEAHVVLPFAGPFAARYRELGIPVHFVPAHKLKRTWNPCWHLRYLGAAPGHVRRIGALLRELEPAIVHVNTSVNLLAAFAARQHGRTALVWHVRETGLRPRPVAAAIERCVRAWADVVVAISTPLATQLTSAPADRPSIDCRVIPNGIDLERTPLRTLAPKPHGAVLGWLGRAAPGKGLERALELFEALWPSRRDLRLRIVAAEIRDHAAFYARQRERARQSKAADAIEWCDATDTPAAAYAGFDLFVHLPDLHEGLGRTVIEAQAVGTPVLSWRRGGLGDALADGVGGRLAPYGDMAAVTHIANELLTLQPEANLSLADYGQRAATFARARFDAKTIAGRVQAIYDELAPCR